MGALRFFTTGAVAATVIAVAGTTLLHRSGPWLSAEVEQSLELVALLLPAMGASAMLARWGSGRQALRFVAGAAVAAAAWSAAPILGKGGLWSR